MPLDLESIALGIQPQVSKGTVIENDHLVINRDESAIASRLPNSPDYNFILRVAEGELQKLETAHLKTWADKEMFERTGLMAVAARVFFERLQNEINFHSSEFLAEEEAEKIDQEAWEMTPEEFIRRGFGMDGANEV